MDAVLHDPWDELQAAQLAGWYIGIPLYDVPRRRWQLFAFQATDNAHPRRPRRERTAVGQTQEECIREMARCLREIDAGRVPK